MHTRKYSNYDSPQQIAAAIASEVIQQGRSLGWCGETKDLEAVREVLTPLNIRYTDDMLGEWRLVAR